MNRQTDDDNDSNEGSEVATTDRWPREVNAEMNLLEDESTQHVRSTDHPIPARPSNIFGQGKRGWQKGSRKQLAVSLPVAAGLTDIFDTVVKTPSLPTTVGAATIGVCSNDEEVGANNWGGARMEITDSGFEVMSSFVHHHDPRAVLRNQMMTASLQALSTQSDHAFEAAISTSQSGSNIASANAVKDIQNGKRLNDEYAMVASIFNNNNASANIAERMQIQSCNLFSPQLLSNANAERFQIGDTLEIFPMTLHRMLKEVEHNQDEKDVVMFIMPLGQSFIVKDIQRFESEIMPRYFPRMKRFASFQRQLNLYNFSRVGGTGPSRGAYFHELFVRGEPDLACQMRRTKIKGLFKVPVEKRRYRPQQQSPQKERKDHEDNWEIQKPEIIRKA